MTLNSGSICLYLLNATSQTDATTCSLCGPRGQPQGLMHVRQVFYPLALCTILCTPCMFFSVPTMIFILIFTQLKTFIPLGTPRSLSNWLFPIPWVSASGLRHLRDLASWSWYLYAPSQHLHAKNLFLLLDYV